MTLECCRGSLVLCYENLSSPKEHTPRTTQKMDLLCFHFSIFEMKGKCKQASEEEDPCSFYSSVTDNIYMKVFLFRLLTWKSHVLVVYCVSISSQLQRKHKEESDRSERSFSTYRHILFNESSLLFLTQLMLFVQLKNNNVLEEDNTMRSHYTH
jgi:hypothetical protein